GGYFLLGPVDADHVEAAAAKLGGERQPDVAHSDDAGARGMVVDLGAQRRGARVQPGGSGHVVRSAPTLSHGPACAATAPRPTARPRPPQPRPPPGSPPPPPTNRRHTAPISPPARPASASSCGPRRPRR